jgi:acyl dehydratase
MRSPRVLLVGERADERRIGPITQTHIVRFAGAGGDFNPLHHDPDFANHAGFSGVIAMGQMQAGMLAGYVSDWVGIEHLHEFEARFVAPVHLGDMLELSAEVISVSDGIATIRAAASVDGRPVVEGSASAAVAHT